MSLIAEVIIPQMFTAFAQDLGYSQYNGLHHKQYYCKNCGQSFGAAWGVKPGCSWRSEYGDVFHCPRCGTEHSKHVVITSNEEELPDKVRLTVKEYQDVVTFEVNCKTVYFTGVLVPRTGRYKEVFRFDIRKQSVLFYKNSNEVDREVIEIGNPFDVSVFEKSILWYFRPVSLAVKNDKKELNRILRVLRETVHRKIEKHRKHKISSMFVSPGTEHGTFLFPLLNIAYRVSCSDAPNLTSVYRERKEVIEYFWDSKIFSREDFETLKNNMAEVIKLNRKRGNNFVSSMIQVFKLPDTPFIRKTIHEEPFNVMVLSKAFQLCRNYDNARRLYQGLLKMLTVRRGVNSNILWFLQEMKPLYGEAGIVNMVEKFEDLFLFDSINQYKQLNQNNRNDLKKEKVRIRDLHDWLSIRLKKQEHVNLKFDVPDHIIKRLSMQRDRLSFFLPKESMQLLEAGHTLHNCVASYGQAMKDNKKWVVLVADELGRLVACLEVQGKELVQAKLDKNKPVSTDPKLNAEVVGWAKKAKLKINTSDVNVPTDKKVSLHAV